MGRVCAFWTACASQISGPALYEWREPEGVWGERKEENNGAEVSRKELNNKDDPARNEDLHSGAELTSPLAQPHSVPRPEIGQTGWLC